MMDKLEVIPNNARPPSPIAAEQNHRNETCVETPVGVVNREFSHNEEELNSELDDEDSSSAKPAHQPMEITRPSSTTATSTSSTLKLCNSDDTCLLTPLQLGFVSVLLLIQFYCLFVHGLFGFMSRLEFLPLLLTSVGCAVGVVWSWLAFYHQVVFS